MKRAEPNSKIDETERANDDLRNFIASADIAMIFVDLEMCIRRYTPYAELLFGIVPTDVGRSLLDITHRLDYPTLAEDTAVAMNSLHLVEREVQSMDSRSFVARLRPYQTTSGKIDGAVLTFVEITRLRIAEERLMRDDDELHVVLQQSKDFAVIVTDPSGHITGWNEGAERVFGYVPEEVLGRSIHLIFLPEDIADGRPEKEMYKARTTGRAEDDRWHQKKGGTRIFCSGVMTQLSVGSRPGYIKIVRDVTQQQRLIQVGERKLAHARARRADAEAAVALKDEFLAVMSHELKHPLNLINVNAELIARAPDLGIDRSPMASSALKTISRAVRTQTKIIDDLLDLSRMRTGKLTLDRSAVDFVALVEAATEAAASDSLATGIDFSFQANDSRIVVDGDAARLNQIIWNLLSNAIKFTPAGGRVRVRVSIDGAYGKLEVTDSGIGIEPAFLPKIFEMFGQGRARASSSQRGLGIGLAVVRQLTEHHGGRIEGLSAGLGLGAEFKVWIPLYQQMLTAPSPPAEPDATRHCTGMRILVVDDDRATVDALKTLLELEGAMVAGATSADEALAHLESEVPDIVLTDLGMPNRDGYALLKDIQARPELAELPVVALTGFGRQNDVSRTMTAGFADHIGKPVVFSKLLQIIAELTRPPADPDRSP